MMAGDSFMRMLDEFRPPATRADLIRAMSDEELAAFLAGNDMIAAATQSRIVPQNRWLDWLQSPAEGGDHDA